MTWLITISTAAGPGNAYPLIGDLTAHIASLSDDEPMSITALAQP